MNPRWRSWLHELREGAPTEGLGLWRSLSLSALVGVGAGCGAVVLVVLLQFCSWIFLGRMAGYQPQVPAYEPRLLEFCTIATDGFRRWTILVLPALGGLLSGWFVLRLAPEAEGHGTDSAIEAYHFRGGRIRPIVPPVKALAAALVIGTGGSAGLEGPISQIGAGIGSTISRLLRLNAPQRRLLMAAGMAGGVGALFHAPMAGALFAAEVLYRDLDLEYEVLVPSIVASVTAYTVFSSVFGFHPLFQTPDLRFEHPRELLVYLLLALVVAAGSRFYTHAFYGIHDAFHRLRFPRALKPALGGLLTGLVGFFFLPAVGAGYGTVQRALVHGTPLAARFGAVSFGLLAGVFLIKTMTTAFSVGSGGAGGIFGPAIVVGGALGGATGLVLDGLLPGWNLSVGSFTMLGMVSFFGCVANTPVSTILMVSEMTGNYHLLVPAMWVCILAYVINRKIRLYRSQLPNRFEAPVHRGSMIASVLRTLRVSDLLERSQRTFKTVHPNDSALQLSRPLRETGQSVYPVVHDDGTLAGVVTASSLRALTATGRDLWQTLLADDLIDHEAATVTALDTLQTVLHRLRHHHEEQIVVCDESTPPRPVGILSHNDIMTAYHEEIAAQR